MELSEKLKAKLTETKNEPNTLKWMDLLQQIGALVIDHQDAIIAALDSSEHNAKCVQFAEDVKRLSQHGGVWIVEQNNGKYEAIFAIRGKANHFYGETPQHAARKAVEALTKGEA